MDSDYEGGCLYVDTTSTVTISSCTFRSCRSTHANLGGGCIYLAGGTVNIAESDFVSNSATKNGGVLYFVKGFASVMESRISYSKSDGGGGAIACYGADLEVVRTTFTENEAKTDGGAVSADLSSTITFRLSTFTHNHAGGSGGAATFYKTDVSLLTIENCVFDNFVESPSSTTALDLYFYMSTISKDSIRTLLTGSTSTSSQPRVCIGQTGYSDILQDPENVPHIISTQGTDTDGCGGFSTGFTSNSAVPCATLSRFVSELRKTPLTSCQASVKSGEYSDSCIFLTGLTLTLEAEAGAVLSASSSSCSAVLTVASGEVTISQLAFSITGTDSTQSNSAAVCQNFLSASFISVEGVSSKLSLRFCTVQSDLQKSKLASSIPFLLVSAGNAHLTRCQFSNLKFRDTSCIKTQDTGSLDLTDSSFNAVTSVLTQSTSTANSDSLVPSPPFPAAFGSAIHAEMLDTASLIVDNTTFASCSVESLDKSVTVCGGCIFISLNASSANVDVSNSKFTNCFIIPAEQSVAGAICFVSQKSTQAFTFRGLNFVGCSAKVAKSMIVAMPSIDKNINSMRFDKSFLNDNANDMLACNLTSSSAVPILSLFKTTVSFYLSSSGSEEECGTEAVPCRTFASAFTAAQESGAVMGPDDTIDMIIIDSVISNAVIRMTGIKSLRIQNQGSAKAIFECLSPAVTESEEQSGTEDGMLVVLEDTTFSNIHFTQTCNLGAVRTSLFHHLSGTLTLSSCAVSCINEDRRIESTFIHTSGGDLIIETLDASHILYGRNRVVVESSTKFPACLIKADESAAVSIDGLIGSYLETDSTKGIILIVGKSTISMRDVSASHLKSDASFVCGPEFSSMTITQSSFANLTCDIGDGSAVNVFLRSFSSLKVVDTIFSQCSASSAIGRGGAIHASLQQSASLVISGCTFSTCRATGAAGIGGAICLDLSGGFTSVMSLLSLTFTSCSSVKGSKIGIVCTDEAPALILREFKFDYSDNSDDFAVYIGSDMSSPHALSEFDTTDYFVSSSGHDSDTCGKTVDTACLTLGRLLQSHMGERTLVTIVAGSILSESDVIVIGTVDVSGDKTTGIQNIDQSSVFIVVGSLTFNSLQLLINLTPKSQPSAKDIGFFAVVPQGSSLSLKSCTITTTTPSSGKTNNITYPFMFVMTEGTTLIEHSSFTELNLLNVPVMLVSGGSLTISDSNISNIVRTNNETVTLPLEKKQVLLNSAFLHIEQFDTETVSPTVSIKRCVFEEIEVHANPKLLGWSGYGGVIYANLNTTTSFLTLADSNFTQITLDGIPSYGGVLYLDTSAKTFQFTSLRFSRCTSQYGTAIFVKSTSLISIISSSQFSFDKSSLGQNALQGQDLEFPSIINLLSVMDVIRSVVYISTTGSSELPCGSDNDPCSTINTAVTIPQTESQKMFLIDSTVDCFGIDVIGEGEYAFNPKGSTATLRFVMLDTWQVNNVPDNGMISTAGLVTFTQLTLSAPEFLHRSNLFLVRDGQLVLAGCSFVCRGVMSNAVSNSINFGIVCTTGGSLLVTTFELSNLKVTDTPLICAKGKSTISLNGLTLSSIELTATTGLISAIGSTSSLIVQGSKINNISIKSDSALLIGDDCGRVKWIANSVHTVVSSGKKGSVMRITNSITPPDDPICPSILISDSDFNSSSASGASAFGGCLYVSLTKNASMSVVESYFTACTAPKGKGGAIGLVLDESNEGSFVLSTLVFRVCSAVNGAVFAVDCSDMYTQLQQPQFDYTLPTESNQYIAYHSHNISTPFEITTLFQSIITVSSTEGNNNVGCGKSGVIPCASMKAAITSARTLTSDQKSIIVSDPTELILMAVDIGTWGGLNPMNLIILGKVQSKLVGPTTSSSYGLLIGAGSTTIKTLTLTMAGGVTTSSNLSPTPRLHANVDFAAAMFIVGKSGSLVIDRCIVNALSTRTICVNPLLRVFGDSSVDSTTINSISLQDCSLIDVEAGKIQILSSNVSTLVRTSRTSLVSTSDGSFTTHGAFLSIKSDAKVDVKVDNIKFRNIKSKVDSSVDGGLLNGGVIGASLRDGSVLNLNKLTFNNCSVTAPISRGGCVFVDESQTHHVSRNSVSFTFTSSSFDSNCHAGTGIMLYLVSSSSESISIDRFSGTYSSQSTGLAFVVFDDKLDKEITFNSLFFPTPPQKTIVVDSSGSDSDDCGTEMAPCKTLEKALDLESLIRTIEIRSQITVTRSITLNQFVLTSYSDSGTPNLQNIHSKVQDSSSQVIICSADSSEINSINITLDECSASVTTFIRLTDSTLKLDNIKVSSTTSALSYAFITGLSGIITCQNCSLQNIQLNDSLVLIFLKESSGTINDFTLSDTKTTSKVASANEDDPICTFSTSLINIESTSLTIANSTFKNNNRLPFSATSGKVDWENVEIERNGITYLKFPSRQERIQCSGATMTFYKMWDEDTNSGDDDDDPSQSLSSLWILADKDCEVTGLKGRPSYFFSPTLTKLVQCTLKSSKGKRVFEVDLKGSTLLPCGLSVEVSEHSSLLANALIPLDSFLCPDENSCSFTFTSTLPSETELDCHFFIDSPTSQHAPLTSFSFKLPKMPNSSNNLIIMIIIISVSIAVAIVALIIIIICCRMRSKKKFNDWKTLNPFTFDGTVEATADAPDKSSKKKDKEEELKQMQVQLTDDQDRVTQTDRDGPVYQPDEETKERPAVIIAKPTEQDHSDEYIENPEFV
ncbi:hypothetical protein BLNAU_2614 [Blattamonas nauphoetae]|uniref:Uncharacterized protein n=1 Tax=Blattamonas nauphoetae TaxID=2049346 RepID=A0ABQ9YF18_9EUKA|nr:hypothetical protein BLNAU_2614 [Blattamonas nauphoetae]